jgi:hypothetical protein
VQPVGNPLRFRDGSPYEVPSNSRESLYLRAQESYDVGKRGGFEDRKSYNYS